MNEENNQNQPDPAPVETETARTAAPEQRQDRPRRRFGRRRFRNRDRFGGNNIDNSSGGNAVDTMEAQTAEGTTENGEPIQAEPEFGEGIIEISGKGFGFLRDPNTKAPPINLQIPPFLRKPLLTNFKISNSR